MILIQERNTKAFLSLNERLASPPKPMLCEVPSNLFRVSIQTELLWLLFCLTAQQNQNTLSLAYFEFWIWKLWSVHSCLHMSAGSSQKVGNWIFWCGGSTQRLFSVIFCCQLMKMHWQRCTIDFCLLHTIFLKMNKEKLQFFHAVEVNVSKFLHQSQLQYFTNLSLQYFKTLWLFWSYLALILLSKVHVV